MVAERVVHELEVVEVEVDHADAEVVTARTRDGRLEHLLEERPVRKAGELVVVREEGHLLLGTLALGDVEDHALDQPGIALLVVDRVRLLQDPADAAVLVDHPVLVVERLVRVVRVPVLVPRPFDVLRVHVMPPGVGIAQPLFGLDAQELHDLRAHVDRVRILIDRIQVHDRRDVLHERPILRLGLESRGSARLHLRPVPERDDQERRVSFDAADVHLDRELVPVAAPAGRVERRPGGVLSEFGREQPLHRVSQQLAAREARQTLARRVRVDDLAAGLGHDEGLRGRLQKGVLAGCDVRRCTRFARIRSFVGCRSSR